MTDTLLMLELQKLIRKQEETNKLLAEIVKELKISNGKS